MKCVKRSILNFVMKRGMIISNFSKKGYFNRRPNVPYCSSWSPIGTLHNLEVGPNLWGESPLHVC